MDRNLDQRTGPVDQAGTVDWIARTRNLVPLIASASDRIERDGRLPTDLLAAMHEAELFRMCLPASLGGGEASPLTVLEVLQIVAGADASTAWCLGQALGCATAAAHLEDEVAREVFGAPDAVLAWGPTSRNARAVATKGGFRVSGEFRFASGSRHAAWLGAHCGVFEADGTRRTGDDGKPVDRTVLFPYHSAAISDVWQVVGLKGTGSDNYTLDDLLVPEAYTYVRDSASYRRQSAPLYRIPIITFYGIAFAGVALGIARATLDDFIRLAAEKVAARTTGVLREHQLIQVEVALAEARLGSSRAYLVERVGEIWRMAAAEEDFTLDQRARLRIAISYAMNQAREVVEIAFRAAGTNAIFEANPFERRFRDMHAVAQQGQASQWNFEAAGQALLGLDNAGGRL